MSDPMSDPTTGGSPASSLMSTARDAAGGAYEEARAKAAEVAPRIAAAARAEAMGRAEDAKEGIASQGERLADALRSALTDGDQSVQARLMAAAADSVEELATSLRGRSLEQLLSDAGAFARRNPGAFVAAAALAGFAVARFARATSTSSQSLSGIEGDGLGSSYGSPRTMGSGYVGGMGSGAGGDLSGGLGGSMGGMGTDRSTYATGGVAGAEAMSADTFGGTGGSSMGDGSMSDSSMGSSSMSGGSMSGSEGGLGYGAGTLGTGGSGSVTTSGLSTLDDDDEDPISDASLDTPLDADPEGFGSGGSHGGSHGGSQGGSIP